MGIFRQFPYSNFHEMNLDEMLKILRIMKEEWDATKEQWASYKDYIDNYFNTLDLSEETYNALLRTIENGIFHDTVDPVIITETAEWLTEHITQPVGVVIDNSLTVSGACADARATGDAIRVLTTDIDHLESYKVAQPLDSNNQPIYGNDGQVLRTKGNGFTEWAEVGLPTDNQTAQAVSEWLNNHPEATTTVVDGSLTESKFSNTLKLKTIKDYVTPEMFGCIGDGVTNDSTSFRNFLKYCYDNSVTGLLLAKTYLVDPEIFNYSTPVESFTLIGVNKLKSKILLSTTGWFFNQGENNLFNKAYFKNINFSGNEGHGYGFKLWSNGLSKQLRFDDCWFVLDGILETNGTGNADINTFFNCGGYLNEFLLKNNNPQSVASNFIQGDFVTYGDLVVALTGGCTNFYGGAYDMLGNNRGFVVNAENETVLGLGDWEYNFYGSRFELHNSLHGAFVGKANKPIKVTFNGCNFGVVTAEADDFCNVLPGNIVNFVNCTLDDNCRYSASGSTALGVGALLTIRDCCIGRTTPLASRVTISGNTARIISTGNYIASSDIGTDDGRSNDFDFGWDNNKSRSVIPATQKIMPIKPRGSAWPFHDGTNNIRIYPSVGSLLQRIIINIPSNDAGGETCTLKITNNDGSKVYYQSDPFIFTEGLTADVIVNEIIEDNLLMTMTNTAGVTFYYAGGIAYITYI